MKLNLSASEQLAYSTVRISTDTGTGTGFFFQFCQQENGDYIPSIVTNKHVIEGAKKGEFRLTSADEDGNPQDTVHHTCSFDNFEAMWIKHPDKDVDLCVMPIAPIIKLLEAQKKKLFFIAIHESLLPTQDELSDFHHVEDILMVGYPNGLWDEINNMPLFRKGITSTHPKMDWNGKKEMLIDAACFPGSSGSPVFQFNEGGYMDKRGNTVMGGTRVKLLGVLYAGPQHKITGEIEIVTIPTIDKPVAISGIPNNIGIIIKAERLRELDKLIFKKSLGAIKI